MYGLDPLLIFSVNTIFLNDKLCNCTFPMHPKNFLLLYRSDWKIATSNWEYLWEHNLETNETLKVL